MVNKFDSEYFLTQTKLPMNYAARAMRPAANGQEFVKESDRYHHLQEEKARKLARRHK